MSPRRRRPLWALAAPVLVTMLALGSLLTGVHTTATAATSTDPSRSITVTMSRLTPLAPQPGQPLTITGRLKNTSSETVTGIYYGLLVGGELQSRNEFQGYAQSPDVPVPRDYTTPAALPGNPSTLEPGQSEPYTLTVDDVSTIGLPYAYEVYQMAVGVTGYINDAYIGTVGQLHTFLPWAPRGTIGQKTNTSLAWVVPLIDRPHKNPDGTWFDDDLAPELMPGGRLTKILNAGIVAANQRPLGLQQTTQNVAVTWAIDPMLLTDVESMASGYRVQKTTTINGKVVVTTVVGSGTPAAKLWLSRLRAVVLRPGTEVMPLPFADPDVVAAVRGKLTTEVGLLINSGRTTVQDALPGATVEPIGWPPGGMTNSRTADVLTAAGDTSLVLDPQALPVVNGPPAETPSAVTSFSTASGDLTALLSDAGLNDDVTDGPTNPAGLRAAVQQFVAETLMIHAEDPNDARSLVVTPNRHWNPPSTYAAQLLEATGRLPWLAPVNLSTVAASPPWKGAERGPLQYPASAKDKELPQSYIQQSAQVSDDIASFRAILPPGTNPTNGYLTAQEQTLSSAWRNDLDLANQQLGKLKAAVGAQMRLVRISTNANSYVTLTSHGGRIPVTVENDLGSDVTVQVRLLPNARLTNKLGSVKKVTVLANQQKLVTLSATAKTSGVFPITVQLETPDGQAYGKRVPLFVRSTVYGTITLLITGVATAALMIAVVIRLSRRGLAARRSAKAGSP